MKKINNQILGEFKFRFKSSEKKEYFYAEKLPANNLRRISTALFTRLHVFLSENGQVVTNAVVAVLCCCGKKSYNISTS